MQEAQVTIEELDDDGCGVGNANGGDQLVVAGALPGETVRVVIEHRSPHAPRAWARLRAIVGEPSPARIPPACPAHGRCGGCALGHLAYPAQLQAKRRRVERRLAEHPALIGLRVRDVVPSPRVTEYRNKAKLVVAAAPGGGIMCGSYAPRTHQVVDMAGCLVAEPPIDSVARAIARICRSAGVLPYREHDRTGDLRYVVIRANARQEVLVALVAGSRGPMATLARVAHALRSEQPAIVGVVLNVNDATSGRIFGDDEELLDGAPRLVDQTCGVPVELSARSFFQVNRAQAERLYAEIAAAAAPRPGARIVDAFCGAGALALAMARAGAAVVGIDASADAVADAKRAASTLGLSAHASFEAEDAAVGLPAAVRRLGSVDVMVVDPPRKGLSAMARSALVAAAPERIVYASCEPRSLAADLVALGEAGYRAWRALPLDMMPGTPEVETVVTLERARPA